ncbi:MAG: hypothetical protein ABH817_00850 [archaeon]
MRKTHYENKEFARILGKKGSHIQRIRKELDINIKINTNGDILIEDEDSLKELLASEILEAVAYSFDLDSALLLKDTNYVFKKIDLKIYAKSSRIKSIKSRLIGSKGRAKKVIESLANCAMVVTDHFVGLIGKTENIELASHAIRSLIRGAPHSNVYKFLEKQQKDLKRYTKEQIEEMIDL